MASTDTSHSAGAALAGPSDASDQTAVTPAEPLNHKPERMSPWKVFRQMPIVVKFSTIWLFLVLFAAIYSKLDATVFNGALPLQNPNLQLNNFNPATGEFGTAAALEGPSRANWLGTDALARDTFARLVHGAWVSLIIVVVSVFCGMVIGGFLGSLVGFVRKKTETVVMAVIDVILAFPALVLLLALVSIFQVRDLFIISFVIGVLSIPVYTRVARANSLAISNREYVLAARAIGTKAPRILLREVIPNVLPTLFAYAMIAAAAVIVVEGSLSFLGLSVQLPTATWGNMINQARRDIKTDFWQVLYPSLTLTITVLSLNQVGDWFQRRAAFRGAAL